MASGFSDHRSLPTRYRGPGPTDAVAPVEPEPVELPTNRFKHGDQAQLNSGGPLMTVSRVGHDNGEPCVECVWFTEDGYDHNATFYEVCLTKRSSIGR